VSEGIPEGWTSAPLSDLFAINPGKPSVDALPPDTEVDFVPMPAVSADAGAIQLGDTKPYIKARKSYTAFAEGDVILAKITPCFENGKAAVVPTLKHGLGFGSTEFHVFRPTGAVEAEYLFHFLRQESLRRDGKNRMTGAVGQARVPVEFMRDLQLPVPPPCEQRRIIEKIEELLAQVDAAKERLEKVPAILKRFRQSVLAAAYSGRLTQDWRGANPDNVSITEALKRVRRSVRERGTTPSEPRDTSNLPVIPPSWVWARLPEVGEMTRGRSRNRPRNDPALFGGKYPFVQTGDVAQSGGRITSHTQTYNDAGLAQSRLWSASTVCITIAANIANSAILTYPACFPDSVVGVVPEKDVATPEFVEYFIRTAREDLAQFAPETAQKNINIKILNEVMVPLPPQKEQDEIVSRVGQLFQLADSVDVRVVTAERDASRLSESVLAKAFRGELVPIEADLARQEGRDFETAAELLERVKADQETATTGRRKKAG
jgi:type I restriction enzyme, S subunit